MLLYLIKGEELERSKKKDMSIDLSQRKIGLNSLIDNNICNYSFIFKIYKIK